MQQESIADAFRDHCVHALGIHVRRKAGDLSQQAVPVGNTIPREEPKDMAPNVELFNVPFIVVTGSYDSRALTPSLMESMRYGVMQ